MLQRDRGGDERMGEQRGRKGEEVPRKVAAAIEREDSSVGRFSVGDAAAGYDEPAPSAPLWRETHRAPVPVGGELEESTAKAMFVM